MISANEARQLYQEPELTLEEIEKQIRKDATGGAFSVFPKRRLSDATRESLMALGYVLLDAGSNTGVRWDAIPESASERAA